MEGKQTIKITVEVFTKEIVIHYTVTHTQLLNTFFRERTGEQLSQHDAITQGPQKLPKFVLSILHLTYFTVFFKKDFYSLHF